MFINCSDNAEKEYKKRMNPFKTIPKKKNNQKNKNKKQKKRNN